MAEGSMRKRKDRKKKISTLLVVFFLIAIVVVRAQLSQEVVQLYFLAESDTEAQEVYDASNTTVSGGPDLSRIGGEIYTINATGTVGSANSTVEESWILNMEGCGNWLFAEERYYIFKVLYYREVDESFDFLGVGFRDGNGNNIYAVYDVGNDLYRMAEGEDYAIVRESHDYTNDGYMVEGSYGGNFVTLYFEIYLYADIIDDYEVDILGFLNTTNAGTVNWEVVEADYFHIYSKGGRTEWYSSGSAGLVEAGDTWEIFANQGGAVAVNQTWRKVQHMRINFGLRLYDLNETQWEDMLWQDYDHSGEPPDPLGTEPFSDSGDWLLKISFWYCDPFDEWTEGWSVMLIMEEGDIGPDDYWTTLHAYWYRNDVLIKNDTITCFVEKEPQARVKIYADLWFNQINASKVAGGRVNPEYYGMSQDITGLQDILWGNWAPLIHFDTDSDYFYPLVSSNGTEISATQLDLMKVEFTLEHAGTGDSDHYFTVFLSDFNIAEKTQTTKQMVGVQTPAIMKPLVPDMGPIGVFGTLYQILSNFASGILRALSDVGTWVWNQMNNYIPYFTEFWDAVYKMAETFYSWLVLIWGYITQLLAFLGTLLGYLSIPADIISNFVSFFQTAYDATIGQTSQPLQVISLILIILLGMSILNAFDKGDFGFIWGLGTKTWGIAHALYDLGFNLITFVVNMIMKIFGLIRGG